MNVTRASRIGSPGTPLYTILSVSWLPFVMLSFAGTVAGLYSGAVWVGMNIFYFVFTMSEGLKR